MKYPISVCLFDHAFSFWRRCGFEDKKVPALADNDVMDFTCPPGAADQRLYGDGGHSVVASAEQSFLQLDKDGELPIGNWMALTPCYRDEAFHDDIHLPVFLKLELIKYGQKEWEDKDAYALAVRMEEFFFEGYGLPVSVVKTDVGWDVEYDGIELGSFGVRKSMTGVSYVYGTGLAEPRASIALEKFQTELNNGFD